MLTLVALFVAAWMGFRFFRSGEVSTSGRALGKEHPTREAIAVDEFLKAVRQTPTDAHLLSDLAAAYLRRARKQGDPLDLVRALEAADQAVAVDPSLPEAQRNRALALESLSLSFQAIESWQRYRHLDLEPDQASEAESHLASLARPRSSALWQASIPSLRKAALRDDQEKILVIIRSHPQEVRQWIEEDLLGGWGEAILAGRRDEARGLLSIARRITVALGNLNGDWMPADAVAAIDRSSSAAHLESLAQGHAAYRAARALHDALRSAEAEPLFEQAWRNLDRAGSPLARLASLYLAIGTYNRFDFEGADTALRRLLPVEEMRYPGLLGRIHWMLGLVQLAQGDPAGSVRSYQEALRIFRRLGAVEDSIGVYTGLTEDFRYLGDTRETWRYLFAGLDASRHYGSARRRHALLDEAAETCLAAGKLRAALDLREEVVRVARSFGEAVPISHALLQRSGTRLRMGDVPGAAADLEEARVYLERISDEPLRTRVEADLLLASGEMEVRRDPGRALVDLTDALSFHAGKGNHFLLGRIHLARARAALKMGDRQAAEDDLRLGLQEYELQRRRIADEFLQISFFDQSQDLFDEMIRLQAGKEGGSEAAFDYAERERARALLDRLGPMLPRTRRADLLRKVGDSMSARQVLHALPSGLALIEYAMLPDRLLAWIMRSGSIEREEIGIGAAPLKAQVEAFRSALVRSGSPEEIRRRSAALHETLIRPVLPHLMAGETVVFVPDRLLHAVPFAALLDPQTNRFLIQDRAIVLAPSATLFLQAQRRELELANPGGSVLVVGNPHFRRDQAPGLVDLPGAEREAAAVAALYPHAQRLDPDQATKSRFLAAAKDADLVHFAGHAEVSREFPLLSHLLLAPEDESDSGFLYAHELYGVRFERTRLVVLAACSTASGPASGEGVASLARAFLGAGVPAVVASLWRVDDEVSARFFEVFHRRLQAGDDAATALRQAQLDLIASSDPGSWAAFELLGAIPTLARRGAPTAERREP